MNNDRELKVDVSPVDFKLLQKQKAQLLKALSKKTVAHELVGLVAFLDNIQDQVVDDCGVPENEVFPAEFSNGVPFTGLEVMNRPIKTFTRRGYPLNVRFREFNDRVVKCYMYDGYLHKEFVSTTKCNIKEGDVFSRKAGEDLALVNVIEKRNKYYKKAQKKQMKLLDHIRDSGVVNVYKAFNIKLRDAAAVEEVPPLVIPKGIVATVPENVVAAVDALADE